MVLLGGLHLIIPTALMFATVVATSGRSSERAWPTTHEMAASILGGCMYTCTGLTNLALLRSDSRIAPAMAYTNSIMAWSSTCFGPCITFVQTAPLNFAISYGHWYCVPNFGWGVEWGLQLLFEAGSGLRAVALMAASIGSYFLQNLFANRDTGFQLAFLPQVAMAIGMCAVCFRRFQSGAAARALALWVAACVCFLLLEGGGREALVPHIGKSAATLAIQTCDCCQIHFSTRFFVCLFRTKHARAAAKEKLDESAAGSWWR